MLYKDFLGNEQLEKFGLKSRQPCYIPPAITRQITFTENKPGLSHPWQLFFNFGRIKKKI